MDGEKTCATSSLASLEDINDPVSIAEMGAGIPPPVGTFTETVAFDSSLPDAGVMVYVPFAVIVWVFASVGMLAVTLTEVSSLPESGVTVVLPPFVLMVAFLVWVGIFAVTVADERRKPESGCTVTLPPFVVMVALLVCVCTDGEEPDGIAKGINLLMIYPL